MARGVHHTGQRKTRRLQLRTQLLAQSIVANGNHRVRSQRRVTSKLTGWPQHGQTPHVTATVKHAVVQKTD